MDEMRGRGFRVAGIGLRSPPLPLPVEGCPPKALRNPRGSTGTVRPPGAEERRFFPGLSGWKASVTSATKTHTWVRAEIVWARVAARVRANLSKWMGAPFAAVGESPAGAMKCARFSRILVHHESETEEEKRGKQRPGMVAPPRPPQRLGALLKRAAIGRCEAAKAIVVARVRVYLEELGSGKGKASGLQIQET